MVLRKIIKIDETLCNGCGNCMIACAEGAIELIDGKARVVSDKYCDGLGACIGECPAGALTVEEREAEEFDSKAADEHLKSKHDGSVHGTTIPKADGDRASVAVPPCSLSFAKSACKTSQTSTKTELVQHNQSRHMSQLGPCSQLSSWPIQMRLAHPDAPYFKNSKLLIAADCSAFACPSVPDFIRGKVVLIGCPKLDDTRLFVERLAQILLCNEILDITVLNMEVPCCTNLLRLVSEALKLSGKKIPVEPFVCMIGGEVIKEDKEFKI